MWEGRNLLDVNISYTPDDKDFGGIHFFQYLLSIRRKIDHILFPVSEHLHEVFVVLPCFAIIIT